MTRLNINIKEGTLEVEGEESFVAGVYADFKEQLAISTAARTTTAAIAPPDTAAKDPAVKPQKKSRTGKARESYSFVKDLDLSDKSNTQSLRSFYEAKKPSNAMERNTVFVYYLEQIAGIGAITLNHIYSCYKNVEARIPAALRQSLADTAFHKGYVDTSSFESIKLATPGENFVEQDLPRANK